MQSDASYPQYCGRVDVHGCAFIQTQVKSPARKVRNSTTLFCCVSQ